MNTSQVSIDQSGRIIGGGIHDAVIRAFRFVEGERFDVCLRDPDNQERWICLVDLPRIGFRDVINGSVISEVFCWRLSDEMAMQQVANDAWRVLLGGNYVEMDFKELVSKLAVRYASMFLVLFESSYGGSIAAICREIQTGEP